MWTPSLPGLMEHPIEVDPERAAELIEAGEVQLIDVREPYEVEAGRIEGARHVGLAQLSAQADSIDRERPVLFYCRVGSRSFMAASAFQRAGFEAYSLAGGLVAWDARGLPLEPEDGHVANH
jgi:rhodanese-related sulfurtransferase